MCLQPFMHKICLQYQIDMLIVLFLLVNNFNKICWFSSEKIRGLRTPKQLSSEFSCTAVEPTYFSFFWGGEIIIVIYHYLVCRGILEGIFFLFIIYFNWRIIIYTIMMVFAIHQYELTIGIQVCPLPFTPSLQVVTEQQLWVPCITHETCTGYLFYIW